MTAPAKPEALIGRTEELRVLRAALQKRESRLIWGPVDAGKSALIISAISEFSEPERERCLCWTGPTSGRRLLSYFVGRLFQVGDPFVRMKVQADGASKNSLSQWLNKQTSLRLRGILFSACKLGRYRFFLDHFPPATHNLARLMKEIMYTCATPVYLAARGYTQDAIGHAWSLYWNDSLRVHLGPLNDGPARELVELCIHGLHLDSLDLEDFREEILTLSRHFPGSIVKMCRLATNSKYHYGDRIKIRLVHLDYLMQSSPCATKPASAFLQ